MKKLNLLEKGPTIFIVFLDKNSPALFASHLLAKSSHLAFTQGKFCSATNAPSL